MAKIVIEIKDKYCNERGKSYCVGFDSGFEHYFTDDACCTIFGEKLEEDIEDEGFLRCKKCLDAEKTYNRLKECDDIEP